MTHKNTGMTRKLDNLGRIVLPAEIRRAFDIAEGDYLDISVSENQIILQKVERACTFCSADVDIQSFRGRLVCLVCRKELSQGL